ncbi:hypothetical protein C450_00265 [Halococcus salifodinae DSM 8989]|uniref:Uncharacterized protein n=1 Tax=Halococcus salifodinae DSM 8989 TaxID=1227456 RepID=M0NFN7_9EURY|nr:hypothetical protein C450_00265 [Halococcus salifodinae DSM 8989]
MSFGAEIEAVGGGLLLQRVRDEAARVVQDDRELFAELVAYRPETVLRDLSIELVPCESHEPFAVVGDGSEHVYPLTSARDRQFWG